MYPLKYVTFKADGSVDKTIRLGRGTPYWITSANGLNGVKTEISVSQGFGQIGENIDALATKGIDIEITGKIISSNREVLNALVMAMPPMSNGRLYFADKFWIDVYVKNSPEIKQALKQATFTFRLYASFPFWRSVTKDFYELGEMSGGFQFYSEPPEGYVTYPSDRGHSFSMASGQLLVNCINHGNVKADFTLQLFARGYVKNITITNIRTQEYLKLNVEMNGGDYVYVYRENNILRCIKDSGGVLYDVFSALDEDSDLYYLAVGDNSINAVAEDGNANLNVSIETYPIFTGVFYGM